VGLRCDVHISMWGFALESTISWSRANYGRFKLRSGCARTEVPGPVSAPETDVGLDCNGVPLGGLTPPGVRNMRSFTSFIRDDRGMETVEWAVLAALIVAGLIAVIAGLGTNVLNRFTTLQTATQ
jgi:Flp pilus assembly pilin Flp